MPEDAPDFDNPWTYPEWALRKVATHLRRLPWELRDVPEDEIATEFERLDLQEEIAQMESESSQT